MALTSWHPAGNPVLWGHKLTYLDLERGLCRSAAFALTENCTFGSLPGISPHINRECSAFEAGTGILGKGLSPVSYLAVLLGLSVGL